MRDTPDTMHHTFFLPCGGLVPPGNRLRWRLVSRKFMVVGPWGSCSGGGGEGRRGNGQGEIRHQSSHHRGVTQPHEELWNRFGLGIVLRLDKKAAAGNIGPALLEKVLGGTTHSPCRTDVSTECHFPPSSRSHVPEREK